MKSPNREAILRWVGSHSFAILLALIACAGIALRLVFASSLGFLKGGDAWWYSNLAIDLSQGTGFVDPLRFRFWGETGVSFFKPPFWPMVLAFPSWLFPDNPLVAQRVMAVAIGASVIFLVGSLGRRLAGKRAGILAGALAAVDPNFVMLDGLLLVESIYAATLAAVVLVTYRFEDRRDTASALTLGVLIGLAALQRFDALLLLPLLVAPLMWRVRAERGSLLRLSSSIAAIVLVIAPWSVYATSRSDSLVLVSSNSGEALINANCEDTWEGSIAGYWSPTCLKTPESERGLEYAKSHLSSAPRVILQRVGRTFDVYRPLQNKSLAELIDRRPSNLASLGLIVWYLMVPLSIVGFIVLRRRQIWTGPLLALILLSVAVSIGIHGETRFRVPAEVAVTVLSGVGLSRLMSKRSSEGG